SWGLIAGTRAVCLEPVEWIVSQILGATPKGFASSRRSAGQILGGLLNGDYSGFVANRVFPAVFCCTLAFVATLILPTARAQNNASIHTSWLWHLHQPIYWPEERASCDTPAIGINRIRTPKAGPLPAESRESI